MPAPLFLLSVPGLRTEDVARMPFLEQLAQTGGIGRIAHSFPAVTWPSQSTLLTGTLPDQHGVIANGFYWRERNEVEMWTAWNKVIERPQLWDMIRDRFPDKKSAAWFPMLSKGCGADYICMPAPIHKPDGSEELWCYSRPQEFYGELLAALGHFPLKHFWGPLAGIQSSQWIADSAVLAARKFRPDFWYIYLPHLDYAAQKSGPDSPQAFKALADLDRLIGRMAEQMSEIYGGSGEFIVASEYVITAVNHYVCPNRLLRQVGLLSVITGEDGVEYLDLENSRAWAMVDHQFAHVFVKDHDPNVIGEVITVFSGVQGISGVLADEERQSLSMDHPRSGDVILISEPDSWMAWYWWLEDRLAPSFARTVDIHRKPGYDPVELFFDPVTKSIPIDAGLVKGSHGAPAVSPQQQGALITSWKALAAGQVIPDTSIAAMAMAILERQWKS
jgi:predicted AlkP superfamily pyrophosphatase or phosphodiesterase